MSCLCELVLQRHVGQLSMAQVIVFQELKSFLRISIRTWLMDQNPCETSHFLAIGVLTQRCSTRSLSENSICALKLGTMDKVYGQKTLAIPPILRIQMLFSDRLLASCSRN